VHNIDAYSIAVARQKLPPIMSRYVTITFLLHVSFYSFHLLFLPSASCVSFADFWQLCRNIKQIVVYCLIQTFCTDYCFSTNVMNDWKLKTTPVVRLRSLSKTSVYYVRCVYSFSFSKCSADPFIFIKYVDLLRKKRCVIV